MIRAVLFDVGGVLHTSQPDEGCRQYFAAETLRLLKEAGSASGISEAELMQRIVPRAKEYKAYVEEHKIELPPVRILSEFFLRDFGLTEKVLAPCAERICYLYDAKRTKLTRRPRLRETVEALHDLGLRQGIISNIISTTFVPEALVQYGIADYMECVVMSSETGIRKPDPEIFRIATDRMGLTPEECAYVGDTVSRDVIGSRKAGMGLMIQIRYPPTEHKDAAFIGSGYEPDYKVEGLEEIVPIIRSHRDNAPAAKEKEEVH